MAGLTGGPPCHPVRLEATEYLMLRLPLPERLVRHLACCAECAADIEGTEQVLRTFRYAEYVPPGAAGPRPAPSAGLGDLVVRRVRGARSARRCAVLLAAALTAAGFLGTGALVLRAHGAGPPAPGAAPRVTLTRTGPPVAEPWGTRVPVALSGLLPGRTYHVVTRDAAGHRTPAGSVCVARSGTGAVRVELVSAMSRDAIVTLIVDDAKGHEVAETGVPPGVGG
ncbi:hypothetical protein POF50_023860 [Streptomyces sp. SL13]|uniref:Uncharacterized protein n=1 Tax=Streptantibioticus silvisoli TaxID=2705255 RepID=A0AA90HCE4_9ACTN|nr:hypothetical protein [Streptantibioticus silvisoli]MDI5972337.1 hypothetical protein [Streptantibioticus silvisoli]